MKIYVATAILLGTWTPCAAAQEDELTPARAIELLEDAQRMMEKAEELLNESSRGQAPESFQQTVLARIAKLVEKAEKKEKGAAEMLGELIRKARSAAGQDRQSPQARKQPAGKRAQPGDPAPRSHEPKRADEPSKFISPATKSGSWGKLPPDVRRAILSAGKEDVPPEFLEVWRNYVKLIEESGK